VAVGKVIVKVPDAVLSEPKSRTATAALVVPLYIKAPRHRKLDDNHEILLNETYAVEPELAGAMGVNISPPAVYPAPTTSSADE
jgi:hypothetical protein